MRKSVKVNKLSVVLFAFALAFAGAISPVQADLPALNNGYYICTSGEIDYDDNNITYTINHGVVTGGSGCSGAVVIPEGVTSIGAEAFSYASLTSISIPSSVTSIGNSAFLNAANLETVSFAQGSQLELIGEWTFASATSLTSITIPASVTSIGAFAFRDDVNLETVSFAQDSQLEVLAPWAFSYTPKLFSITIPASVTSIGDDAFTFTSIRDFYFLGNAPIEASPNGFSRAGIGATAHIRYSATGFGSESTWNALVIDRPAPVIYTVTYDSTSGADVSSGTFFEGGSIETAPVSSRAGYTLVGWSATVDGGVVTFPYAPGVSNDITLYAIWTLTPSPSPSPSASSSPSPSKTEISSIAAKFPTGSSLMKQTGEAAIKKIVKKVGADATFTVTGVAGKSIGVPDSKVKALAKARALKVQNYLIKLGVKKSHITLKIKIIESGITPKTKILAKYVTN